MSISLRIALAVCAFTLTPLKAESYISFQFGSIMSPLEIDLDLIHIGQPTYCDSLLYPNPSNAPTDGACALFEKQRAYAGKVSPDGGWFAGFAHGRNFGSWRFEGFYERNQMKRSEQLLPLATTGNAQMSSKSNEWSQFALPSNTYDD